MLKLNQVVPKTYQLPFQKYILWPLRHKFYIALLEMTWKTFLGVRQNEEAGIRIDNIFSNYF